FERLPAPREAGRAELPPDLASGAPGEAYGALDAALEAVELCCVREAGVAEAIAQLARRASLLRAELARVIDGARADVVYCERRAHHRTVGASPVDVSSLFRREVLERVPALVLTSAT